MANSSHSERWQHDYICISVMGIVIMSFVPFRVQPIYMTVSPVTFPAISDGKDSQVSSANRQTGTCIIPGAAKEMSSAGATLL